MDHKGLQLQLWYIQQFVYIKTDSEFLQLQGNLDSVLVFSRKGMVHTKIRGLRRSAMIYIKIKDPELILLLP
jgi:hypothetical protein